MGGPTNQGLPRRVPMATPPITMPSIPTAARIDASDKNNSRSLPPACAARRPPKNMEKTPPRAKIHPFEPDISTVVSVRTRSPYGTAGRTLKPAVKEACVVAPHPHPRNLRTRHQDAASQHSSPMRACIRGRAIPARNSPGTVEQDREGDLSRRPSSSGEQSA